MFVKVRSNRADNLLHHSSTPANCILGHSNMEDGREGTARLPPVFVVAINATHFVTVDGQLSILRSIVTHGVRRKQRPIVHILRSKHVP